MNGYRKEYKYIVDDDFLLDVRNRISQIMPVDKHQKGEYYNIRSIYLDSPGLRCLRENEAGISTREKYRIRVYDCSPEKISAEVKIRHRDTITKMSADISPDLLCAITANDRYIQAELMSQHIAAAKTDMAKRSLEKYMTRLLAEEYHPVTIVAYERSAFVYDMCNVRITFDRNVGASEEYGRFFDKELDFIPAIEGGRHVLEIKYDEFLPDEIAALLSGLGLKRESCSKYVRCMYAKGM